jgi:hypothetical protein
MILPDMTTSRIRDSVLQLVQSVSTSWEETIVSTNCDPSVTHLFSRYTSDVFALDRFLEPRDVPGFLRYLIESRRPDVVLLNSELACLMVPFLRAMCPDPLYVSCCLADDGQLEDDGNARCSVVSRDQLDLILVSSDRLGDWMTARGVDGARIEVCRAYGSLSPTMDHMEGLFTKARRLKDRQPLPIVDPDLARDIAVRTVEYMRVASLVELLSQERDALRKALKAIDERRPTDVTDPNVVAQSIIEGTLRYRVSDRLNDFLKGLRLQAPIKTIMKALIARDK